MNLCQLNIKLSDLFGGIMQKIKKVLSFLVKDGIFTYKCVYMNSYLNKYIFEIKKVYGRFEYNS